MLLESHLLPLPLLSVPRPPGHHLHYPRSHLGGGRREGGEEEGGSKGEGGSEGRREREGGEERERGGARGGREGET